MKAMLYFKTVICPWLLLGVIMCLLSTSWN